MVVIHTAYALLRAAASLDPRAVRAAHPLLKPSRQCEQRSQAQHASMHVDLTRSAAWRSARLLALREHGQAA